MSKKEKTSAKELFASRSSKAGSFSLAVTACVLAIIVIVNLILPKLPAKYTSFDMTATGRFSIGEQSKQVISSVSDEIYIYYICSEGEEDPYVKMLLDSYSSEKNIKVKSVDPVASPKFTSKFTSDEVAAGSVIVNCGERSKVVSASDLYEYTMDYSTYSYQQTAFAAENMITNAIAYVISEDLPTIQFLKGHGEAELDQTFSSALTGANYNIGTINLVTSVIIPADTDCIAIISPASDISADEKTAIMKYISGGGKVFMTTDSITKEKFPNLYSLLGALGIEPVDGIIIELDSSHCYDYSGYSINYYLLPEMGLHDITEGLDNYYIMFPDSQGFNMADKMPEGVSVEPLVTTTDKAYSAINIEEKTSSDKEEGDIDTDSGFRLGAAVKKDEGNVVYYSSSSFMQASVNQAVAGANAILFVNSFNWLCETKAAVSIPSQSLTFNQLTMNASTANTLSIVFIILIPVILLVAGIVVIIRRKRR